jgi:magnesium transporter
MRLGGAIPGEDERKCTPQSLSVQCVSGPSDPNAPGVLFACRLRSAQWGGSSGISDQHASQQVTLSEKQMQEIHSGSRNSDADQQAPITIAGTLSTKHVADVVEWLNVQDPAFAASVLDNMPFDRAVEVLEQPGFDHPQKIIENLPVERAAALVGSMSPDRRADIFRLVPEALQRRISELFDASIRASLQQLQSYSPTSAGGLMTTEFVTMPANWTVEQALQQVRQLSRAKEPIYAIYVTDPDTQRLLRVISLRQLLVNDRSKLLSEIGSPRSPVTTFPNADQEDVARLISKYDLLSVPVVDDQGRVMGIVTVDDIIDAIVQESTEDVQKFGGMAALDHPYMEIGFGTMISKRAGWLCVLFLSELLTASAMQTFQNELERAVVLTLFVPLIMSSGGNSGSQATSLLIRALALREVQLSDWWRVAVRELPTGLTLGAILALIAAIRISVWQLSGFYDYGPYWHLISVTVAGAVVGIVTFGSLSGSMLPFVLKRLGFDPASASAPFVATLVDVTGLIIYFSVAYLVLKGTLL